MIEVVQEIAKLPLPDLSCPGLPRQPRTRKYETAVLHISDVQWGKITSSYSSKVAEQRLLNLAIHVGKIIDARKLSARIDELRLFIGGDIVEGENIFPGQSRHIDASVYAQAIHGASASLSKLVLRMLRHVPKVVVRSVRGNHGRDPGGSSANWDEVCYEVIKRNLLGGQDLYPERKKIQQRIEFGPIGEWYNVDRVYGYGNLLIHGDQLKGSLGGNNFKVKIAGWIDAIPEPWDYLWLGHFHQYSSWIVNNRTVLVNGTTESDNQYAQESFAGVGIPCQRLGFFTEKYGLTAEYPVYLIKRKANGHR
jgi:hypothetical protein